MDNAIKLSKQNHYTFRIVTLKGDIINPSGGITGGSVQTKSVNILGRKKYRASIKRSRKFGKRIKRNGHCLCN